MDTLAAIKTRRSIRKYTQEPIGKDALRTLVEAAMFAPSAANQQAWHYIIIDERKLMDAIPTFHPYCPFITSAQAAVVVCGDLERERFNGLFWVQDCSAATQNLLLAAHAQGIGATWLAVYPIQERINGLRELLAIPDHLVPLNVVSLGMPAGDVRSADRYDEGKVSWNRF